MENIKGSKYLQTFFHTLCHCIWPKHTNILPLIWTWDVFFSIIDARKCIFTVVPLCEYCLSEYPCAYTVVLCFGELFLVIRPLLHWHSFNRHLFSCSVSFSYIYRTIKDKCSNRIYSFIGFSHAKPKQIQPFFLGIHTKAFLAKGLTRILISCIRYYTL